MVIERYQYQCEVCKTWHDNEAAAIRCESNGDPPEIPTGMIVEDTPDYLGHHDLALLMVVMASEHFHRHSTQAICIAFRDWYGRMERYGKGDSTGNERVAGPHFDQERLASFRLTPDRTTARYRRAWEYAEKIGITLTVMQADGTIAPALPPEGK